MILGPVEARGALHVISNMREWDRREIFATRTEDDDIRLLEDVLALPAPAWMASKGEPIALFGCVPLWPGVWSMWFFATDNLHQIGIGVTRVIIKAIVPMLWEGGAHRLECRSMEGHTQAQDWLEVIGARRECTLRRFGREGEDFHVYVWEKP
jgi:hypothetical protein